MRGMKQRDVFRFLFFPKKIWVLILADAAGVSFALIVAYALRLVFSGTLPLGNYASLAPLILVFPFLYGMLKLYPGNFLHPSEELKRLSLATSCGFLLLAATFFLAKSADTFSRAFFLGSWFLALFSVPLYRYFARRYCRNFSWWSSPYVIIAGSEALSHYFEHLSANPSLELAACAVCTEETGESLACRAAEYGINVLRMEGRHGFDALFSGLASRYPEALVMMHVPSVPRDDQEPLLDAASDHFRQLIMIPDPSWHYCMPSQVLNLRGTFALAIRRNLADKRRLRMKRAIDLSAAVILGIVAIPVFLVIALYIKKDSKGPVFFRQKRIGQHGKDIYVFKFRTMVADAEVALEKYLSEHPELREEWNTTQKLKDDPRITRVGAFLRRTSLDELPQLLNVLAGDMSLVGPRPIVRDEVEKYGAVFKQYCHVPPGITGLWQISGRNDVSYDYRVRLDRYYISNWSVWLDIYVLAKTLPAVLARKGAY